MSEGSDTDFTAAPMTEKPPVFVRASKAMLSRVALLANEIAPPTSVSCGIASDRRGGEPPTANPPAVVSASNVMVSRLELPEKEIAPATSANSGISSAVRRSAFFTVTPAVLVSFGISSRVRFSAVTRISPPTTSMSGSTSSPVTAPSMLNTPTIWRKPASAATASLLEIVKSPTRPPLQT